MDRYNVCACVGLYICMHIKQNHWPKLTLTKKFPSDSGITMTTESCSFSSKCTWEWAAAAAAEFASAKRMPPALEEAAVTHAFINTQNKSHTQTGSLAFPPCHTFLWSVSFQASLKHRLLIKAAWQFLKTFILNLFILNLY